MLNRLTRVEELSVSQAMLITNSSQVRQWAASRCVTSPSELGTCVGIPKAIPFLPAKAVRVVSKFFAYRRPSQLFFQVSSNDIFLEIHIKISNIYCCC